MSNIMVIGDISTVGNCSLAVDLPVLSAMGHHAIPLVSAVLSAQTEFPSFYFDDRLESLNYIGRELECLDVKVDAILLGYLPSAICIENLWAIVDYHLKKGAKLYIDPILGDDGKIYATVDEDLCMVMKEMVAKADVAFPNLSEACLLTDEDYIHTIFRLHDENVLTVVSPIARKLLEDSLLEKVIITGIKKGGKIYNLYMDDEKEFLIERDFLKVAFSGTGDIFAAVVTGEMEKGKDVKAAIEKACDFVEACINSTESYRDPKYGTDYFKCLKDLID